MPEAAAQRWRSFSACLRDPKVVAGGGFILVLIVLALGALASVFVLIRVISIPDSIPPPAGRGIGIWISLLASLAVIVAGLLRASEEL